MRKKAPNDEIWESNWHQMMGFSHVKNSQWPFSLAKGACRDPSQVIMEPVEDLGHFLSRVRGHGLSRLRESFPHTCRAGVPGPGASFQLGFGIDPRISNPLLRASAPTAPQTCSSNNCAVNMHNVLLVLLILLLFLASLPSASTERTDK